MNLIKKLISILLGDEEKEYETRDTSTQDHESVKNVLNVAPREKDNEHDHQKQKQFKAEARVSYQYPKGNFRFPIIPDDKQITIRQERFRRSSFQGDQTAEQESKSKRTSYKGEPTTQHSRASYQKQKPIKPKSLNDEKVEEKKYERKQPFTPTSIPSPVYGFQTREERVQNRGNRLTPGMDISSIEDSGNEQYPPTSYEKPAVASYQKLNDEPLAEKPEEMESFYEQYEDDHVDHILQNGEEVIVEEHTDDEVLDEALTIVRTEFNKQVSNQLEEQQINKNNDSSEGEREHFIDEMERNDCQAYIEQADTSTETESDERHYEEEHHIDEKEAIDHYEEIVENPNNPDLNHLATVQKETVEQSSEVSVSPSTDDQDSTKEDQNKRKSVPFNVMMLGRDKQRIREKEQGREKEEVREKEQVSSYQFPSLGFLNIPDKELIEDHSWLESQKELLNLTLKNFNVRASVVNVTQGPSVTRFEVHPEPGVKVNKITNLSDDIKLSLAAKDIRIEAPIPGKNTIGIEVPNKVSKMVYLREILRSTEFRSNPSPMTAVLGLDIAGQPAVTDLKKMPHGLIAGATGSGKSVCINTILVSLLYKASPHEVKLMLIDPKMVELAPYNDIPHLVSPVITDVKAATAALKWAVEEMERRYELFAHSGTREITRYNQLVKEHKQGEHLPYLVIIIDELADLMMVAPNDVEEAICRIAQKARACGIHLIVATQRPSVDVITGLIKANIPTRIAFSVSSQVDSRTIIDVNGAEKLLGKGDMLFLENGSSKAVRLQGTFVSDEEIERVVKHVKLQSKPEYLFHQEELVRKATIQSEEDELFLEACEFVVNQGGASTSSLQRRFRIGYNRAARLIDMMEDQGIISENRGSKPRDILISEEELDSIQESNV